MQSQRGVTYTATAIGASAPVLGVSDGPGMADIHGTVMFPPLMEHARVAAGARLPVTLTTTHGGHAWVVTSGKFAGYLVPYHHSDWSVNPAGSAPAITGNPAAGTSGGLMTRKP
jgi:hypothetical protein